MTCPRCGVDDVEWPPWFGFPQPGCRTWAKCCACNVWLDDWDAKFAAIDDECKEIQDARDAELALAEPGRMTLSEFYATHQALDGLNLA